MDETRRQVLTQELDEVRRERDRLTAFIELLSERLGVAIAEPDTNGHGAEAEPETFASGDPVSSVAEGEFYGMSAPKASRVLLNKFGRSRPMKTDEIFRAITRGGVNIKDSGGLYRSLFRDPAFHKVGRGVWGLSEWYPNAKREAKDESPPDPSHPDPTPAEGTELGPQSNNEGSGAPENGAGQPLSAAVPDQETT